MPHGTAAKTRTPPADIPAVVKRQQQVRTATIQLILNPKPSSSAQFSALEFPGLVVFGCYHILVSSAYHEKSSIFF
jgi:hypothetical protein